MKKLFIAIAALVATSTGIYLIPSVSTVHGANNTYFCGHIKEYHMTPEDRPEITKYCSKP